ncbi:MAG: hypothetical protein U0169_06865 [Polyangiaceae bacterium]
MEFSDRSSSRRSAFRRTIRTLVVASLAIGIPAIVSACSAPPTTGFLVVLDSQLPLAKVIVRIGGQDGSIAYCRQYDVTRDLPVDRDNPNSDGKLRFPANVAVQPSSDPEKAKTVRVTLLGYDGITEPTVDHCTPNVIPASVVRTDVLLQYVKDDFLEVPMPFTLSCVQKECGGNETCRAGECVPLRANDRSYRKLADGVVNAGDCYSLDPCVAPTRLENIDGCRFALPSGRSPSGLSPFATYDFEDGRLAGVEFLTEDVASISGSTLTLNGDLCTKYTNGYVRTISVAQCPSLANQTFCPANAEKAASFAAIVDPERFGTGEPGDGGVLPDGGVSRDSGADATVNDAGPDGAGNDGSSGDGSSAADGGGAEGGSSACGTCCGTCVQGTCVPAIDSMQNVVGTPLLATVEPLGQQHSTAFWVSGSGFRVSKVEAVVDAVPSVVRIEGNMIRAIARAGRYVAYAAQTSGGGGGTDIAFIDADSVMTAKTRIPLAAGEFESRLAADPDYVYVFHEAVGTNPMTVRRIPIPDRAPPLPDVTFDLGISNMDGVISFAATTDNHHLLLAISPTGGGNAPLLDVDFSMANPTKRSTVPIVGAPANYRDLGIASNGSSFFRMLAPFSNPYVMRYDNTYDPYRFLDSAGANAAATTSISQVNASASRAGKVSVVYAKDAETSTPEVWTLHGTPGIVELKQVASTFTSQITNVAVTRDCVFVTRAGSPVTTALVEGFPMP